jgi:hypothetical protein
VREPFEVAVRIHARDPVGHHTSGLGYAVDLDDALARFAAVLRR